VYKLTAIQDREGRWQDRLKLSEQTVKVTNPGFQQIRRYFDGKFYTGDAIYDEAMGIEESAVSINQFDVNDQLSCHGEHEDLLKPVMRKGVMVYQLPSLSEIQNHAKCELQRLPPEMERLLNPQPYFAGLEKNYYQKKLELIKKLRKKS
jgi:nicotinate phosphoribosyltransferase